MPACIYRQCIYINRWPNGCSWFPKPFHLLWVESTPGVAHLACCFKTAQTQRISTQSHFRTPWQRLKKSPKSGPTPDKCKQQLQ